MGLVSKIIIFVTGYIPLFVGFILVHAWEKQWDWFFLEVIFATTSIFGLLHWLNNCRKKNDECHTITTSRPRNAEALGYLVTYSLPTIGAVFNPNNNYLIVSSTILAFFMIIYVRMDVVHVNPTLFILGYRVYDVSLDGTGKTFNIVSKSSNLVTNRTVLLKSVDNYTYFLESS